MEHLDMQDNKNEKSEMMGDVPAYAVIKPDARKWVPLSPLEREHRGWGMDVVLRKVKRGTIKVKYTDENDMVLFERVEEKAKFRHMRKLGDGDYEREERALAQKVNMPYWYDVERGEEARRQKEEKKLARSAASNVIWGPLAMIGAVLGFIIKIIIQMIVVIVLLLLARDATQWFLGTGKYSKKR